MKQDVSRVGEEMAGVKQTVVDVSQEVAGVGNQVESIKKDVEETAAEQKRILGSSLNAKPVPSTRFLPATNKTRSSWSFHLLTREVFWGHLKTKLTRWIPSF